METAMRTTSPLDIHPSSPSALAAALAGAALLLGASPALAQCDLKAEFVAPAANNVPGAQPLTWTMRFKNEGSAACAANKLKLNRYSGGTASGYGTAVGGSGAFQDLPALNAGQTADLSFPESAPPQSGTFTYKAAYSKPHNDANNFNHHPTKTIVFDAPTGPPDLVVVSAKFVRAPAVGSCNTVRVTVKNQGGKSKPFRVTAIVFPAGNPFQNRDQKEAAFSVLGAGVTSSREVTGLQIFSQGALTLQVVADSGNEVTESNENNNTLTQSANVTRTCN
jgi:hypothetical protein